jgi:hypothetical protein
MDNKTAYEELCKRTSSILTRNLYKNNAYILLQLIDKNLITNHSLPSNNKKKDHEILNNDYIDECIYVYFNYPDSPPPIFKKVRFL